MRAKILVIEDDRVTLDLLTHSLRARGHDVLTASDGDAALEAATIHAPDIIVCDVNLPTTNGLEVLQRLRKTDQARETPVIAITASGAPNESAENQVRDRITGLGFSAFIPKPVDLKTFAARVEMYLPATLRSPSNVPS